MDPVFDRELIHADEATSIGYSERLLSPAMAARSSTSSRRSTCLPVASDDAAEGQGCLSGAIFETMGSGSACIGCQRILSEVESGTGVGFEPTVQALHGSRH